MKTMLRILLCVMLTLAPVVAAQAGDYVLTVNGVQGEIDLDRPTALKLQDGTVLKLKLELKEFLTFNADLFSFEHQSAYRPNRTDLGDGIYQTTILTPLGAGIIIQEYTGMNPVSLVDLMVQEVTKEEVSYGYTYKEKKLEKKVRGGVLKGKEAVTTYPGEQWTRAVLATGKKDRGLLVMTMLGDDSTAEERALVEHLWATLQLK